MTEYEIELEEFREFFKTAELPDVPFKLNKYMTLHDIRQFIDNQIQSIEKSKGNYNREYLFRHLIQLRQLIEAPL